jgi:hypothetical protein
MEGLEANACIAAVSTSYGAVPPKAAPSTSPSANTPEISKPTSPSILSLSPLVPSIDISSDTRVLTHLNKLYCYFGPIQMLIQDELHLVSGLSPGVRSLP